ncbi:exosortase-associated protein EpsI, B-type [Methylobacillus glycogenes]|uniref:exosortase-associated protein EpsI, B-type n=1 Tax=Methylobacillus glycogenes TaxID=406 RepID=UPI000568899D|nr:exosortase-associated protein EpsI, B-type [Methylobacillus glycogenes]
MSVRLINILAVCMVVSSGLALALTPDLSSVRDDPHLESFVPSSFGQWQEVKTNQVQMDLTVRRDGEPSIDNPYDEVLMRSYANEKGQVIMLALAYGKLQRQEVKVHRPELCYTAQGFSIRNQQDTAVNVGAGATPIPSKALVAASRQREELVLYWIRIGDMISKSAWETRLYIVEQGLKHQLVDGILVRTSQILGEDDAEQSLQLQQQFLHDLVQAVPRDKRKYLIPS